MKRVCLKVSFRFSAWQASIFFSFFYNLKIVNYYLINQAKYSLMHRVKHLGGPGIPENMGLRIRLNVSHQGPTFFECFSLAHRLTHSKARKAQAGSKAFQGFLVQYLKKFCALH